MADIDIFKADIKDCIPVIGEAVNAGRTAAVVIAAEDEQDVLSQVSARLPGVVLKCKMSGPVKGDVVLVFHSAPAGRN